MSKGNMLIVVTGTPGAGKSSFAKELSESIPNSKLIEINDIVEEFKLFSSIDKMGSKIVKVKELESKVAEIAKGEREKANVILVGHLAPELKIKPDVAIVVRVGLAELIKRLEARKYQKEKIKENIVSESVDYCGAKMKEQCKNVHEVETERERKEIIGYVKEIASGKDAKAPKQREIKRFDELLDLIANGNKYSL